MALKLSATMLIVFDWIARVEAPFTTVLKPNMIRADILVVVVDVNELLTSESDDEEMRPNEENATPTTVLTKGVLLPTFTYVVAVTVMPDTRMVELLGMNPVNLMGAELNVDDSIVRLSEVFTTLTSFVQPATVSDVELSNVHPDTNTVAGYVIDAKSNVRDDPARKLVDRIEITLSEVPYVTGTERATPETVMDNARSKRWFDAHKQSSTKT